MQERMLSSGVESRTSSPVNNYKEMILCKVRSAESILVEKARVMPAHYICAHGWNKIAEMIAGTYRLVLETKNKKFGEHAHFM